MAFRARCSSRRKSRGPGAGWWRGGRVVTTEHCGNDALLPSTDLKDTFPQTVLGFRLLRQTWWRMLKEPKPVNNRNQSECFVRISPLLKVGDVPWRGRCGAASGAVTPGKSVLPALAVSVPAQSSGRPKRIVKANPGASLLLFLSLIRDHGKTIFGSFVWVLRAAGAGGVAARVRGAVGL